MKPAVSDFIEDFLGELLEGSAAIFAGAGLSVPAGFVDWRELIRPLAKEVGLNIDLESDLVAVAQFHVNSNGANRSQLHKAVIEALSSDALPTENHRLLARLPISTWWTTNYDKLLENALRDAGKIVDVKSALPQLATTRPRRDATIFKMHGDVDRPDQAVATRDDFEKYTSERGAFITALAGDLVSKTFLFLGFSFTDPNLDQVLTRVRLTFTTNQRRHYAVFKTRAQLPGESQRDFDHFRRRQELVIEDLRRFNVRVLLIDEFSEITEFLTELVNRFQRRTVFISASVVDPTPWTYAGLQRFAQELGRSLIANGSRVATGLGLGVGDAIFTGALREIMRSKMKIEDGLILRPFPQSAEKEKGVWTDYRKELISHAGISLFLFGNKMEGSEIVDASGMLEEFEISVSQGAVVLPIGGTGSVAANLASRVLSDPKKFPGLNDSAVEALKVLEKNPDDLDELIEPIVKLVGELQGGNQNGS
ncbi:hypothetical protein IZ6_28950 [Terrihabitans soli]|uniref:NAD(+) hydrolase ThsA n=1 Tax=Terrihabitans soli TaxID=708113 RepID=A0A6S6QYK5_9HYPH|nr:SIR2 family protein [Terrihabitans soli]BCJ92160.1 hypothetical protein IZ6_28950 [Terrihabitans soli]